MHNEKFWKKDSGLQRYSQTALASRDPFIYSNNKNGLRKYTDKMLPLFESTALFSRFYWTFGSNLLNIMIDLTNLINM